MLQTDLLPCSDRLSDRRSLVQRRWRSAIAISSFSLLTLFSLVSFASGTGATALVEMEDKEMIMDAFRAQYGASAPSITFQPLNNPMLEARNSLMKTIPFFSKFRSPENVRAREAVYRIRFIRANRITSCYAMLQDLKERTDKVRIAVSACTHDGPISPNDRIEFTREVDSKRGSSSLTSSQPSPQTAPLKRTTSSPAQ